MNPGYRVPAQSEEEQKQREDYYKKARASRTNEIQPMDQQELARAQAEGRTPLPEVQNLVATSPKMALGQIGLQLPSVANVVRSGLAAASIYGATQADNIRDWYQRMVGMDATGNLNPALDYSPPTDVGGGAPDPKPDPQPELPDGKRDWGKIIKTGLTTGSILGGGYAVTSGLNDAADRATANESQDATVAQSTSLENPSSFLSQSPEEVQAQTLQDIQDNLALQQVGAQESYSNLYARALQNAYRRSAASTSPFTGVSGGQPAQTQQALSAAEIAQLGNIGSNYNQAMRDIQSMGIAAEQEARQAGIDQYALQQQIVDRNYEMALRLNEALNDPNASDEDSIRIFNALGITDSDEVNRLLDLQEENTDTWWRSLWDTIYRIQTTVKEEYPKFGEALFGK